MRGRCALVLATALSSSCATTSGDEGNPCTTFLLAAVLVPCAVAFGAGCVVGAGTRVCEGTDPDDGPDTPAPAAEVAPSPAEVDDAAY